MTPKEFYEKALEIYNENEGLAGEKGHMDMDDLMAECLKSLGYEDGVNLLFSMSDIWYA